MEEFNEKEFCDQMCMDELAGKEPTIYTMRNGVKSQYYIDPETGEMKMRKLPDDPTASDSTPNWNGKVKKCMFSFGCRFLARGECNQHHTPEEIAAAKAAKAAMATPVKEKPKLQTCRYGNECNRDDCKFDHPKKADVTTTQEKPATTLVKEKREWPECRDKDGCKRKGCSFQHPGRAMNCRYGTACTREGCHFAHPKATASAAEEPQDKKGVWKRGQTPGL